MTNNYIAENLVKNNSVDFIRKLLNKVTNYFILGIAILALLLTFHKTACATEYFINDDNLVELQIAKDAPTRVSIKGEKINEMFLHPQDAAEIVIHNSGYVFLLPQEGYDKVFLTIIGEEGTVQDLSMTFINKTPNPVRFLKIKESLTMAPEIEQKSTNTEKKTNQKETNKPKRTSLFGRIL